MVTIEYTEQGECISDFSINHFVSRVGHAARSGRSSTLSIANGTAIKAVLAEVADGALLPNQVRFLCEGRHYVVDKYGSVDIEFLNAISMQESFTERMVKSWLATAND